MGEELLEVRVRQHTHTSTFEMVNYLGKTSLPIVQISRLAAPTMCLASGEVKYRKSEIFWLAVVVRVLQCLCIGYKAAY